MKDFTELDAEIISLIEDMGGGCAFSEKSKAIIHDVAEYSRQSEMFKYFSNRSAEFMKEWSNEENVTPKDVYLHMLCKIADAPTQLHRNISIILLIPILDDMLTGNKSEEGVACAV